MAKSAEETTAAMVAGLAEKTGKSLADWSQVLAASGKTKHGELVALLKEQGVGHGYANLIAHKHLGSDAGSALEAGEDLVAAQYTGAKAALRPIYEAIHAKLVAFGADVEVAPKKANVSYRRKKQFATAGPGSATRIDVGIILKGVPGAGRLEEEKPGSMCTHRVRVTSLAEVDDWLVKTLKDAYEKAG